MRFAELGRRESGDGNESDGSEQRTGPQQNGERKNSGENAAAEFDQAFPALIRLRTPSNAVHNTRDQQAGFF